MIEAVNQNSTNASDADLLLSNWRRDLRKAGKEAVEIGRKMTWEERSQILRSNISRANLLKADSYRETN